METKHKELYDAPSMLVFELKIEGVVCQSQDGIESTRKGCGTALDGGYWSATEFGSGSNGTAWYFCSDNWYSNYKTKSKSVRPVSFYIEVI